MLAKALKQMFRGLAAEKAMVPSKNAVPTVVHDSKNMKVAEQTYKKLSDLFRKYITSFMLEAGQYIIDTCYGGNAGLALVKNKSKDNPPSLKLLIGKLKAAP